MGADLPYISFEIPFAVFILTGFMKALPTELEEMKEIDAKNFSLMKLALKEVQQAWKKWSTNYQTGRSPNLCLFVIYATLQQYFCF